MVAPAGFRLRSPAEVATGPYLFCRTVLFYWPGDGWVHGTVARHYLTQGLSHVVRYGPQSVLDAMTVDSDSPLDADSHGPAGRWIRRCALRASRTVALAGRP